MHYVYLGMLFIGLFFVLTSAVAMLKMKDIYTRLHAASKGSTFGFAFFVLGVAFLCGTEMDISKAIIAVIFQFVTAPIGAHMIARAAMRKGVHPVRNPQGDPMHIE